MHIPSRADLAHKVVLSDSEVDEEPPSTAWLKPLSLQKSFADREEKRVLKSSVGAQAIGELDAWFERRCTASRDFKDELIDLLDASKFGTREYTPYQVYMKALFEYFRADLGEDIGSTTTRSAVDLAGFQEGAVKKAYKILDRYDGVLIGDSVAVSRQSAAIR